MVSKTFPKWPRCISGPLFAPRVCLSHRRLSGSDDQGRSLKRGTSSGSRGMRSTDSIRSSKFPTDEGGEHVSSNQDERNRNPYEGQATCVRGRRGPVGSEE